MRQFLWGATNRKSSVGGKVSVLIFRLAISTGMTLCTPAMLTRPEDKPVICSNDNAQLNLLVYAITFHLPVSRSNVNFGQVSHLFDFQIRILYKAF